MTSEVVLRVDDGIAFITLNRPKRLNAISMTLPDALKNAVETADRDPNVSVIVLQGEGRAFCSGYDLKDFAEDPDNKFTQDKVWDPLLDYKFMSHCNYCFMSIWRAMKVVICKIQGFAVAGGSDIALCCDWIIMADDAKIGYPPSRLWGCPTTAHWFYRLGIAQAKRMLLTGAVLSGKEAERLGLITKSVPADQLEQETMRVARKLKSVPKNQMAMQKMVINNAVEQTGLFSTQRLAIVMDGISRHTPEGRAFKARAEKVGFKQAVKERDMGTFVLPPSRL
mmetsp:Transcript_9963/g.11056  ORF Transcript_9963/g.11056 Transcript_9963/m.11056 type:complete len:281 (-) Transcript_9963:221-1063(-)